MKLGDTAKEIEVGGHVVECINVLKGKPSKNGAACKAFKWVVVKGKSEGCFITDRFYINAGGMMFLSRMLIALGHDPEMDFDENGSAEYYFNECAGKCINIRVKEETYKGRKNKRVDEYTPLSGNDKSDLADIPRFANEEYEAPAEPENNGDGGYSGLDDTPF